MHAICTRRDKDHFLARACGHFGLLQLAGRGHSSDGVRGILKSSREIVQVASRPEPRPERGSRAQCSRRPNAHGPSLKMVGEQFGLGRTARRHTRASSGAQEKIRWRFQTALIRRISEKPFTDAGPRNPLHWHPKVAKSSVADRMIEPISHGQPRQFLVTRSKL